VAQKDRPTPPSALVKRRTPPYHRGILVLGEVGATGTGEHPEDRISIDPAVCSGKPCIKGTRIMVRNILGMIAGGYRVERVLAEYPSITREDVAAALEYAGRVVSGMAARSRENPPETGTNGL
jgi:uncharacterized protein (DUF433 family)